MQGWAESTSKNPTVKHSQDRDDKGKSQEYSMVGIVWYLVRDMKQQDFAEGCLLFPTRPFPHSWAEREFGTATAPEKPTQV